MSYGTILIEVCDANRAASQELFDLEERYPEVSVLESSCLSECELCMESPYVFMNGDLLFAESVDELIQRVIASIEEIVHSD